MIRPRVLMIAYACDPQGGGEHWLGWGWAEQAAQTHEVDLITTPKARDAVLSRSREIGITPHFVEGSSAVRTVSETVGANWWRKFAWQKKVLHLAAQLHSQKKFQLVHQTTFHTFRVPFLAVNLGVPSLWGPIAGGESVPRGFEKYLGGTSHAETGRRLLNRVWLNFPSVKRSLEKATMIFASNQITQQFLPAHCHSKCQIVPPNALRPSDEAFVRPEARPENDRSNFNLLYVGNCVATRALPLVFDALQESGLTHYQFSIIGDGPAIPAWKRRVSELNLDTKIRFAGKIPHSELARWYAQSDVLVFPALRDSGGSAPLEAMARFVPVICLDWAGPGEMLDVNSGIKVPVRNPESTVSEFGRALRSLAEDPQRRAALASVGRDRALSLFRWQSKREILEAAYQRLIERA